MELELSGQGDTQVVTGCTCVKMKDSFLFDLSIIFFLKIKILSVESRFQFASPFSFWRDQNLKSFTDSRFLLLIKYIKPLVSLKIGMACKCSSQSKDKQYTLNLENRLERLEGPNQNLMEAYTFHNSFLIPSTQNFW